MDKNPELRKCLTEVVGYYAKRAKSYDKQKSRTWQSATGFQKDVLDEIVKHCSQNTGNVIELGVGTGRVASVIIQKFGRVVVGVDVSPEMLRLAKVKAEEGGYVDRIILMQGNIENLPFVDGVFGCGLVISAYHYIVKDKEAALEFHRIMRVGGRFIIGDLIVDDRDSQGFFDALEKAASPVHHRFHKLKERRELFEGAGFKHVSDVIFSYKKEFEDIVQDKAAYFSDTNATVKFKEMLKNAPTEIKELYQIGRDDMILYYGVSVFEVR
jgi:ubiquinone/menaquinone biosynthesis C-methylase UbiE